MQVRLFENSLLHINSKLNSKPYDYRIRSNQEDVTGVNLSYKAWFDCHLFLMLKEQSFSFLPLHSHSIKKKSYRIEHSITKQISCWKYLTTVIRSKKGKEFTKKKNFNL